jgi:hypothetical protein
MPWLNLILALPSTATLALAAPPPIALPAALPDPPAQTAPADSQGFMLHMQLPPLLGNPPQLMRGSREAADAELPAALRETPIERMTATPFLDAVGQVFESHDVEWTTGVTLSVHVQPKTDQGLGRLVPFASILQEVDEGDAHERYGLGVGATYRFNRSMRLDIEGQYLGSSGDVNPLLSDEGRVFVLFTVGF